MIQHLWWVAFSMAQLPVAVGLIHRQEPAAASGQGIVCASRKTANEIASGVAILCRLPDGSPDCRSGREDAVFSYSTSEPD